MGLILESGHKVLYPFGPAVSHLQNPALESGILGSSPFSGIGPGFGLLSLAFHSVKTAALLEQLERTLATATSATAAMAPAYGAYGTPYGMPQPYPYPYGAPPPSHGWAPHPGVPPPPMAHHPVPMHQWQQQQRPPTPPGQQHGAATVGAAPAPAAGATAAPTVPPLSPRAGGAAAGGGAGSTTPRAAAAGGSTSPGPGLVLERSSSIRPVSPLLLPSPSRLRAASLAGEGTAMVSPGRSRLASQGGTWPGGSTGGAVGGGLRSRRASGVGGASDDTGYSYESEAFEEYEGDEEEEQAQRRGVQGGSSLEIEEVVEEEEESGSDRGRSGSGRGRSGGGMGGSGVTDDYYDEDAEDEEVVSEEVSGREVGGRIVGVGRMLTVPVIFSLSVLCTRLPVLVTYRATAQTRDIMTQD